MEKFYQVLPEITDTLQVFILLVLVFRVRQLEKRSSRQEDEE